MATIDIIKKNNDCEDVARVELKLNTEILKHNLDRYIWEKIKTFVDKFNKKPNCISISEDVYAELYNNKKYHFLNGGFFIPNEYTEKLDGDKICGFPVSVTRNGKEKFIKIE